MDQDETWRAGRPRSWPHCVRRGLSSPSPKGAQPPFSAHICCGRMTGLINMPLGMEVGFGPGDFVLDADPATLHSFRPISLVAKRLDASICHLVRREVGVSPGDFVLDVDAAPSQKEGGASPIFGPCLLWPNGWMDQDVTWYGGRPRRKRLCYVGTQFPQRHSHPIFGPCLL